MSSNKATQPLPTPLQMVPYLGKSIEVVETGGGGDRDGGGCRVLAFAAGTAARARPENVGHEGRQVAPTLLAISKFNGRKSILLNVVPKLREIS